MPSKVVAADSIRILALDPSTEITGAVFVEYSLHNEPRLISSIAIDARARQKGDALSARLVRIRWTREQMYEWLGRLEESIDLIAYETDTNRGHSSEALKMAAGAYLCLPHMALQPLFGITLQAACIYAGCLKEYRAPRGKTKREQDAKTLMLKTAVRYAMDGIFPNASLILPGAPEEETGRLKAEAIADALAIGGAAAKVWREHQEEMRLASLQPKLPARQKKAVA